MSETPAAAPAADAPLQFEHAEASAPPACAACSKALVEQYFEANGKVVCTACRDALVAARTGGSGVGRFFRAWGLGLLAAVASAVVFHFARELSGSDWGLIYIGGGWLVGMAVARGAQQRGGWVYQALAIALTWASISWSLIPELVKSWASGENALHGAGAWIFAFFFSLSMPVFLAIDSFMMILLLGIAFWECWKRNRRTPLALVGPFALTPVADAADAATATAGTPEQAVA